MNQILNNVIVWMVLYCAQNFWCNFYGKPIESKSKYHELISIYQLQAYNLWSQSSWDNTGTCTTTALWEDTLLTLQPVSLTSIQS